MRLDEAAKVLNVPVDADLETLKCAYRKMALKWHPDKVRQRESENGLLYLPSGR